jgi:guanyl-specific ribonuclease Sa
MMYLLYRRRFMDIIYTGGFYTMNNIYRWKKRILVSLLMLLMTLNILTGCAHSSTPGTGNASATTASQELQSTAASAPESSVEFLESEAAKNAEISESTVPQVTASKKSTSKDSSQKETASTEAAQKKNTAKKSTAKDSAQTGTKSEKSTTKQTTTKESASEKSSSVKASSAKTSSTKTSSAKASSDSKNTTSGITEDGAYTSKKEVALYLHTYGHLPNNYITKSEAESLGWDSKKGNLWDVAPGKSIGGSHFGNYEKQLPDAKGRKYSECDIDYDGTYRNAKRIIYSNDGLIFYTEDHYKTFEQLY